MDKMTKMVEIERSRRGLSAEMLSAEPPARRSVEQITDEGCRAMAEMSRQAQGEAEATNRTPESAAIATLEKMGYGYFGGELWKPPLGERPACLDDEPEAPEWDGESWPPPIGAIVESTLRCFTGNACEVLAVRRGNVIACDVKTSVAGWIIESETRPIRTPDQRAEESIRRGIVESLSVAAEEGRDVLDDDVCASVIASAIRDGKIPGVKLEDK